MSKRALTSSLYFGDSRQRVLASGLGATLQKTDRILSGSAKLTLTALTDTLETKTTGDQIQLGLEGLDLSAPRDVTVAMGKNYHELSHFLFSPRLSYHDVNVNWGGASLYIAPAWNYLEESRVETLFSALYGKSKFYFTVAFSDMAMQTQWDSLGQIAQNGQGTSVSDKEKFAALSLHLLAHGRAYLPQKVRDAIRDGAFAQWSDPEDHKRIVEAERIIDTFRTLTTAELNEERNATDPNGKNVRFPRWKIAAIKLHVLFPELFNTGNTNGKCQQDSYAATPKDKQQQKEDAKKEEEASQKAEQDKRDDYEEVELSDDSEDEEEDDAQEGEGDGEETAQEDQEGTASGSGEEETDDDEGDDQDASGGSGGMSEDDEEGDTDSDSDDDGSGSGAGDSQSDNDSGEEGGIDEDDEDATGNEKGTGVGGGESDSPLTREEQAELLASVIAQVVNNSSISNEIDRMAADIEAAGEQSNGAEMHTSYTDRETTADREAIAEVSRVFEGLREQVAPGWNYGSDNGRLNVNRAMLNADPDDMYDEWYEGKEDDASVEMVILVDLSGSMSGDRISSASRLVHTLRKSLAELDSHVSIYGFSMPNAHVVLKGRDDVEQDEGVPIYETIGGTSVHSALMRAREVFAQSDSVNRVLTVITDGVWENNSSGTSLHSPNPYVPDDDYLFALRNMGAHKVLCFIDREEVIDSRGWLGIKPKQFIEALTQEFDSAFDCHNPTDLAAPLTEVVREVVQRAIM